MALALLIPAVLLLLALHIAGAFSPAGPFWGVHPYAFLPPGALVAGLTAVIAAAGIAMAMARPVPAPAVPPRRRGRGPAESTRSRRNAVRRRVAVPLASVLAAVVFWMLRSRQILLGDGIAITGSLPQDAAFHPLEPLSGALQQWAFRVLAPAFGAATREPFRVAWDVVAVVSCTLGTVFVGVAWALSGEVAALVPRRPGAPDPRGARGLVFGVLLAQGYLLLFFGYVEVYALPMLALAIYLTLALRHRAGRAPLWPAGAALAAAIATHLSCAVLLPSFAVLAAARIRVPPTERAIARLDVALSTVPFLAGVAGLAALFPGYDPVRTLWETTVTVLSRRQEVIPGYLLSGAHARDLANGQLLASPLAAVAFLALVPLSLRRGATASFLLAAGGTALAVTGIAGDSNLGYARNWDLLAPLAFVTAVAALGLAAARVHDPRQWRAVLVLVFAVSVFHTAPWVAVNASETRSTDRFATLPLGLGRVESTLGLWHLMNDRLDPAERWLVRSLDAWPTNVRAHQFLGEVYIRQHRYDRAVLACQAAARLRPDRADLAAREVVALLLAGRASEADSLGRDLLAGVPTDAGAWTARAAVARALGHPRADAGALARARTIRRRAPRAHVGEPLTPRPAPHGPDGSSDELLELWSRIGGM
jgi:hypothetical protein